MSLALKLTTALALFASLTAPLHAKPVHPLDPACVEAYANFAYRSWKDLGKAFSPNLSPTAWIGAKARVNCLR